MDTGSHEKVTAKQKKNQFSTNSYQTQQRITEKEGQLAKKNNNNNNNKYFTGVDTGLRSVAKVPVAFKVLLIKFEINSTSLFIFNCFTSNINLFIFNCLTSNFCFLKNIFFASRIEWLFMGVRP